MSSPIVHVDGPGDAARRILLAHGAGAGPDTPFFHHLTAGLTAGGVQVQRMVFPYMARRLEDGKKRPPDRQPKLEAAFRQAVEDAGGPEGLVVGGKSMGGRIASYLADELGVAGLVLLGFPFHPPGKPERFRGEHLATIRTPTLLLQGERDPFGRREEVEAYTLSDAVRVRFLADGDHSLKPRKKSGHTHEEHLDAAVRDIEAFLAGL